MAYGVVMYAIDFLLVDMFYSSNGDGHTYLKPVSEDSISWSAFRLHAFGIGLLLVVVSKLSTR